MRYVQTRRYNYISISISIVIDSLYAQCHTVYLYVRYKDMIEKITQQGNMPLHLGLTRERKREKATKPKITKKVNLHGTCTGSENY